MDGGHLMSPSTSTPQDAYKGVLPLGWWTCKACVPNIHDRGGQAAFYAHYNREHYQPKEQS